MDIQGLTPIDTFYEYTGLRLGLRLSDTLLWNGYFVGFVIAGAILYLYYVGSRRGSYTDLAVYPLYVLVIAFLLWPVEVNLTGPGGNVTTTDSGGNFVSAQQGLFWYPDVATEEGQGQFATPNRLRVPRLLALVTSLTDSLQANMIRDVRKTVGFSAFEWLRVSAVNHNTRVLDPDLRHDLGVYLSSCYWPAMALASGGTGQGPDLVSDPRRPETTPGKAAPPGGLDPWNVVPLSGLGVDEWLLEQYTAFPYSYATGATTAAFGDSNIPCHSLHRHLKSALDRHLGTEPFHQKALAMFGDLAREQGNTGLGSADYARFYRRRLLYNETFVTAGNEAEGVRYALPEYSLMKDGTWDLTYMSAPVRKADSLWEATTGTLANLPAILAAILAAVSEWWTQKALGPATYYRVSALGPYIYGFVLSFLLMLFPVAGLMAFWPRWWTAIVNFLKVFISVKLWPVLWSLLSGVLSVRTRFDAQDPEGFQGTFGHEGMLPGLAAMYLLAPFLSYMIVSIAAQAAGASMGALVGAGAIGSSHAAEEAVKTGGRGLASAACKSAPSGGGGGVPARGGA